MSTNDLPDWATVTASPDVPLTGSPMAYINGFTSVTFAIPTGVHLLSIVLPGYLNISEIDVVGITTGVTYFTETPLRNAYQHQYYVLIPSGADSSVSVRITASAAGTAYITGVTDTVAVAALPQNPAPWQAANVRPLSLSFANPGLSGVVAILGGQGGNRSIWLHSMTFLWDVASLSMGGQFTDTSGVQFLATEAVTAGAVTHVEFHGAKLDPNVGIQFVQGGSSAAGTTNCRGTLVYSVY